VPTNKTISAIGAIGLLGLLVSCSNQKNTKTSRLYHDVNTRYNIYFNAEQSYLAALENKNTSYRDNLSELLYVYPYYPDEEQKISGFDATVDKCVKAIKLHSIQVKPERNPAKRSDVAYQEWLNQREFNPFLKNAWLLMGKAEYQSLDYTRSIATFSHISRLYKTDRETATEARLWIANAYMEMNWIYEAENALHQIDLLGGVPDKLKKLYNETYANLLIRSKKYEEAIPFLQAAIKNESGQQALRFKYLLGQLYAKTGNRQRAYEAFGDVQGLNTPHEFSLNAKLQQAQFVDISNKNDGKKLLSSLNKMTKPAKNEEYLDQIYYAIGNIYWQKNDTVNAIDSYSKAIAKSTRNGYDKAVAQVTLGDIFFNRKDYIHAQPLYPEALGILGKKYERYNELMQRSEALDKLAVHAQAIHLQDSLQALAAMSEADRLDAINKLIADLKKKDEEEKKKQAQEAWRQENPDDTETMPQIPQRRPAQQMNGEQQSSFYFYNQQTVSQGKTAFKKLWGNRKLEDNWRRKNKSVSVFGDEEAASDELAENASDSIRSDSPEAKLPPPAEDSGDTPEVYRPEFYLSQIPLTPEAMQESNDIIEDAYFQTGLVCKDELSDFDLAVNAFEKDLTRYPDTPNKEEIYYQLFLIYTCLNDKTAAEKYRAGLLSLFPDGIYAKTLSDPNYEWNLRNMTQIENNLYQEAYSNYMAGNVDGVRTNCALASDKYPLSRLTPKFLFLNGLTYAQTNQPDVFKTKLGELVEKYPDSDVTPLASEMLKGMASGKMLAAGGSARGMIWNIQFGETGVADADSTLTFRNVANAPHLLMLIFDPAAVRRNELLYDVADFNFSSFVLQTFDLNFSELKPFELLQVSGFKSLNGVAEYTNRIFDENSLISKLDSSIIIVPVSEDNFGVMLRGKSLNDYFDFFEANYAEQMPHLIDYWHNQIEKTSAAPEMEPADGIGPTLPADTVLTVESEPDGIGDTNPIELVFKPKTEKITVLEETETSENAESSAVDDAVDGVLSGADDMKDALNAIAENPVDGIKNLINSIKNRPKLTKEEKQAQEEEKRLKKELDKARKAREKAVRDSISAVEEVRQDSVKEAENAKIAIEKAEKKAKEDALKAAKKQKEDAEKARKQQLKDKERARKKELEEKAKARKEKEKQREAERREREKQAREKRKN
jgi:tetratricopeptide (TPR) repeat protein